MPQPTLRPITADDASTIARLHAASWRTAYRGILSDAYLAGAVEHERAAAWQQRLEVHDTLQFGVLASLGAEPVGFVYLVGNVDAHHGSLVDNLHVLAEARSTGLGPLLLAAAADGIIEREWDPRVHLWVWDANVRARAFYRRMGGREVETTTKSAPDGTQSATWRVVWDDVRTLRR